MITANYLSNEVSIDCLTSMYTNNEGYVNFKGLAFTTRGFILGNTSKAGIQFICGKSKTDIFEMIVNSSINSVDIVNYPNFIWANPSDFFE